MGVFECVVVFTIIWWLVFLPILSIGTKSQMEGGATTPGTERAAPIAAGLRIKVVAATIVAGSVTLFAFVGSLLGWFDFLFPQG